MFRLLKGLPAPAFAKASCAIGSPFLFPAQELALLLSMKKLEDRDFISYSFQVCLHECKERMARYEERVKTYMAVYVHTRTEARRRRHRYLPPKKAHTFLFLDLCSLSRPHECLL